MSKTDFGARLKEARKAKKMSREAVAERLEVSLSTVQHHENGDREPDFDTLASYSRMYGRSTDWLVTGKESTRAEIVDLFESVDETRREQLLDIIRTFKKA